MEPETAKKYTGLGVSPGIALAPAVVYKPGIVDPPCYLVKRESVASELLRLETAKDVTRNQLVKIRDSMGESFGRGEAGIIDAHLMVLDDEMIVADTSREISENLHNCEWAVRDTANKYIAKFNEFGDIFFRERASDIADVSRRLLRALMGISGDLDFCWEGKRIVVAENLTPSEALSLPEDMVCGVVLDKGSQTSHAALLVRAAGIPAIFGLGNFSGSVAPGTMLGIDGAKGLLVANPSPVDEEYFKDKAIERDGARTLYGAVCRDKAATLDGVDIACLANIENIDEISFIDKSGAEGVGLFRTEYLWLAEGKPVDEEAQKAVYSRLSSSLGDKPFYLRVFDLGGDKFLSGMELAEREANPFLGQRSIRYLIRNSGVFKIQIRAVLRSIGETGKPISIILPMVSDLEEILESKRIVSECVRELESEGLFLPSFPRIGMMVEVPAAAIMSDVFARHVDFFSIGTNDLTQYTLAVDRVNDAVAHLYRPLHPSVLRLVSIAAEAAASNGIEISVCGEMASDPVHALVLIGLGIRRLSMSPSSIPLVKAMIRKIPFAAASEMAKRALGLCTMDEVCQMARELLSRHAPDILSQC